MPTAAPGVRTRVLMALAAVVAVVVGGVGGERAALAAGSTAKKADAGSWTERVCRDLVDFQSTGLDARDVLWAVAHGAAPADGPARKAVVADLRAALAPVRADLRGLDRRLAKAPPAGMRGTIVRDGLRSGYAGVADAYAEAAAGVQALKTVPPAKVPARTAKVLARLDAATVRAAKPIGRMEPAVRRSSVRIPLTTVAVCRSVGPEWSFLSDDDGDPKTPAPPAGAEALPGAVDLTAPALLLPIQYRPPADIAALAAQTTMTGRSRTFFYGSVPVVETGAPFVGDCPSSDGENSQILGCFHDGRVYVLAVTRPEVAPIVPVVAAHEMLHAAYDAAATDDRSAVDTLLSGFYASTTDTRLQRIVAQYDARAPQNRPTELHSLVGTQVPTLTPDLDAYYARYFHDRSAMVAAYDAYSTLFEGLIARYDDLHAQLEDLKGQIAALQGQSDAAGREANSLAGQIDTLRAQGRIAESNALVGPQNDAVRRAQSFNAQANGLIDQYNALVSEVNDIASQLGGLESSLRPLG